MDDTCWFYLFLFGLCLPAGGSAQQQQCSDLNTHACELFAHAKPDLCSDPALSSTCKRFCGLCPLECYHCPSPSRDPSLCTVTQSCSVGQKCLLSELKSADGHHEFIMACINNSLCEGVGAGFGLGSSILGKRDSEHMYRRDVTLKCCGTDNCNKPQTTTTLPTTTSTTTQTTTSSTTRTTVPHMGSSTTVPSIVIVIPTDRPGQTGTSRRPGQTQACYKDVAIALDSSGSIGVTNFRHLLDFIYQIINKVEIGPQHTQIALETFSTSPHNQWYLNTYSNKKSMLDMVYTIPYLPGGTQTGSALEYIIDNVFKPTNGDRTSAPNAVIVITDGHSNTPAETLSAAKHLHSESSDIIAVGIGSGINHQELQAIASTRYHMIDISGFSQLQSITSHVVALMCQ